MVRPEGSPDELLVVVRATPANRDVAVAKIADDAEKSARVYVVAEREAMVVLHGGSVCAHRDGVALVDLLRRFPVSSARVGHRRAVEGRRIAVYPRAPTPITSTCS